MSQKVGVVAAGAWGTAVAQTLANAGHEVLLWCYEKDVARAINKTHENTRYLPTIRLHDNIEAVTKLDKLPKNCDTLFICCPANAHTEMAVSLSKSLTEEHTLVLCSKGLRESDGALLSELWEELTPQVDRLSVLSGPTFAREMAEGKKTAMVASAHTEEVMKHVGDLFKLPYIRIYYNSDMIGVQICGALKNIIAIATGMSDALHFGDNMRAAIISRGLAEISRYAQTLGGDAQTISGLAGVGDIMLTATSKLSRNYRFGKMVAEGLSIDEALEKVNGYVEGLHTARIVTAQATSRGVDLGIVTAIDGILHGDISMERAMDMLFDRPNTWEFKS